MTYAYWQRSCRRWCKGGAHLAVCPLGDKLVHEAFVRPDGGLQAFPGAQWEKLAKAEKTFDPSHASWKPYTDKRKYGAHIDAINKDSEQRYRGHRSLDAVLYQDNEGEQVALYDLTPAAKQLAFFDDVLDPDEQAVLALRHLVKWRKDRSSPWPWDEVAKALDKTPQECKAIERAGIEKVLASAQARRWLSLPKFASEADWRLYHSRCREIGQSQQQSRKERRRFSRELHNLDAAVGRELRQPFPRAFREGWPVPCGHRLSEGEPPKGWHPDSDEVMFEYALADELAGGEGRVVSWPCLRCGRTIHRGIVCGRCEVPEAGLFPHQRHGSVIGRAGALRRSAKAYSGR